MTSTLTNSSTTPRFALAKAQQQLATRPFSFTLTSKDSSDVALRVVIEPLGESLLTGQTVASFRRTVATIRSGKEMSRNSSVAHIELSTHRFAGLDVTGLRSTVRNAVPLPVVARVGDSGHYFDNTTAIQANSSASIPSATMTWSLDPWENGLALWCIHIKPAGGGGVETAECYAITESGDIVGAALRAWPEQKIGQVTRRMVELRTLP